MDFSSFHIFILTFTLTKFCVISLTPSLEADTYLNTVELIAKNGYPAVTHTVTTPDGYILSMHRIPYSAKSPAAPNKPAVYLQHGLTASSADFVIMGAESSLGYLLADAGYDVFMGNCRGNEYSKGHVSLTTEDKEFWDFSWHEMAVYDVPTMIDFILNKTNQNQIYYVGVSMGTTIFYALASEKPEYNQKIKLMIALDPIVQPIPTLDTYKKVTTLLLSVYYMLGIDDVFQSPTWFARNVCPADKPFGNYICNTIMSGEIFALEPKLNKTLLPVLYSHYPDGTSLKTMTHLLQLYTTGRFEKWDYLPEMNLVHYNQSSPLQYNISAVTAPVVILYSDSTIFSYSRQEEVLRLRETLPNCMDVYEIRKNLNNLELVYGIHAKEFIYDKVLELLK